MKFQILFSGKNQKNILKCHLLNLYPECLKRLNNVGLLSGATVWLECHAMCL